MPPVGMITVGLPAFIASRTSIHVISSSHTVSGLLSGFGVSMQLSGLAAQLPPPADRGSRCCPWGVTDTSRSRAKAILVIGDSYTWKATPIVMEAALARRQPKRSRRQMDAPEARRAIQQEPPLGHFQRQLPIVGTA